MTHFFLIFATPTHLRHGREQTQQKGRRKINTVCAKIICMQINDINIFFACIFLV